MTSVTPQVLHIEPQLSKVQTKTTHEGQLVTDTDYDTIVSSSTDAYDADSGKLLFKFRKHEVPKDILKVAHDVYDDIDKKLPPSTTRNKAAGPVSLERWREFRNDIESLIPVTKYTAKLKLKNGRILSHSYSNPVRSYTAGFNYWRYHGGKGLVTGFSKKYPEEWKRSLPLFGAVYGCLKRELPDIHKLHAEQCDKHRKFTIPNTNLTTVAINVNYESSFHLDNGDLPDGFSTLTVLEVGRYIGGYLVFPRYRLAVDVREGDVILNQSHKLFHGNSPIHPLTDGSKRISFVTYLKKRMAAAQNLD